MWVYRGANVHHGLHDTDDDHDMAGVAMFHVDGGIATTVWAA